MKLTTEELYNITGQLSDRDVQIARLTLELDQRKSDIAHLSEQVETLRGQLEEANRRAEEYAANLDQEQFYNSALLRLLWASKVIYTVL